MKTIPISAIHISPNRQRREFDLKELNELGESIKRNGLFHAIVLRKEGTFTFEPGDGSISEGIGRWFLVSGERRLRAIFDLHTLGDSFTYDSQLVPVGEIPYVDIGDLDELAREEAEYDENKNRRDLTWQEDATATMRLALLRTKQALAAGLAAPLTAVIAKERRGSSEGIHQEITRREIIVAKHLDDPEVRAAKNVDDAFKILRRKEDIQKRVELAATIGKTYSAETAHTALNEDSLAWMTMYEGEPFDVICTDPIFGISADEFGDSGGHAVGPHSYEDSYETWQKHISVLAHQSYRICKPAAHLYAFCDITRFEEFKSRLSAAGWQPFRTPITWHYPNGNRTPWVEGGPQRKHGWIVFARKGDRKVTRIYPDLVTYAADENLGHHAQKPVALYTDLLRRSVGPGDKVLDPFMGTGPIFPAANELKCRATGIEIDPAAYAIAAQRLQALQQREKNGI